MHVLLKSSVIANNTVYKTELAEEYPGLLQASMIERFATIVRISL